MRTALLDGDCSNYDMERGYTRHAINEAGDNGILIKLGKQFIVNHVNMLLWDRDLRFVVFVCTGGGWGARAPGAIVFGAPK